VLQAAIPKTILCTAALLLAAACSGPTEVKDPEVDFVGVLDGIALDSLGQPLDSVRILPIGAADEAIYAFAQALSDQDGRYTITVTRKGKVGGAKRLLLTVNVIATAYKGYNEMPDALFPTQYVTVPMEFVPLGTAPTPAQLEIRF